MRWIDLSTEHFPGGVAEMLSAFREGGRRYLLKSEHDDLAEKAQSRSAIAARKLSASCLSSSTGAFGLTV